MNSRNKPIESELAYAHFLVEPAKTIVKPGRTAKTLQINGQILSDQFF